MLQRNGQSASDGATPASKEQGLGLHVGDWVEVRPLDEILATLDEEGCLDALPFMPEMVQHCGGRFTVFRVAHKTCDNIESYHNRRMRNAVHLTLRCDGSAHGGCQAKCLFFWKEAWLRQVSGPRAVEPPATKPLENREGAAKTPARCDLAALHRATRQAAKGDDGEIVYRCQSTEMLRATSPLSTYEVRQYVQDVTTGNVTFRELVKSLAIEFYNKVQGRLRIGSPYPSVRGRAMGRIAREPLNLQLGELVQVRSKEEIEATIGPNRRNRGLSFEAEMVRFCGGVYRVAGRIEQMIDERTGKMLKMRHDCIVLDGAICTGGFCRYRLFCPRGAYPFWREAWLRRVSSEHPAE